MTLFPISVKVDDTSTVVNPVTQTALTEVNKASIKRMGCVVARGKNKSPAPNIIKRAKLPTKIQVGFSRDVSECVTTTDNLIIEIKIVDKAL